jgi:hypothetical protein
MIANKRNIIALLWCLITLCGFGQEAVNSNPQMADTFRSEGKIYVVITVMAMVFLACVAYLIIIERRLKKLEDKNS